MAERALQAPGNLVRQQALSIVRKSRVAALDLRTRCRKLRETRVRRNEVLISDFEQLEIDVPVRAGMVNLLESDVVTRAPLLQWTVATVTAVFLREQIELGDAAGDLKGVLAQPGDFVELPIQQDERRGEQGRADQHHGHDCLQQRTNLHLAQPT
jgi:hypothetical protein